MTSLLCLAAFLLLLSHAPLTAPQQQQEDPILKHCYDEAGNYTSNSQFSSNLLNEVLKHVVSEAPLNRSAYSYSSAGQGPDRVFGFAQCMSAAAAQDCGICLQESLTAIARLCPSRKQALVLYDNCTLRYSNQPFISQPETITLVAGKNENNATELAVFSTQVGRLIRNLLAESSQSPSRFAVGSTEYGYSSSIYGMAQCTMDLSVADCHFCLDWLVNDALDKKNGAIKIGARLYFPSCSIRYENFAFYPAVGLPPPPSQPSPPTPSSPPARATPSSNSGGSNSTRRRNIIIGVTLAAVSVLVIVIVSIWCASKRKHTRLLMVENDDPRSESIEDAKPLLFDLNEIRAATDSFSDGNKLGAGGFGAVYKGKLSDGQEIAVKRLLASSSQGITELKNEVALLAKLQHRNLVKLLGCCLEDQEKLLIYEFVPNSSLEKFLFDPVMRELLRWELRYKIIIGIARGLLYLHEDSRLRIIHRDLKASNILLDAKMNAKISDFGLAKIFGADQTQGNTSRVAGTFGYMSPEYVMHGHFSTKSDVYSFGVLALEIVTGRKNSGFSGTSGAINLLSYVWDHWLGGKVSELIDESMGEDCPRSEVLRCVHIGLLCVQNDALERPSMSNVQLMLSSQSVTLATPSPPAFGVFWGNNRYSSSSASRSEIPNNESTDSSSLRRNAPESVNEASITEPYPR